MCSAVQNVQAKDIAYMANEANGRIVLTNEICKANGKTFPELRRVYTYTGSGYTLEGCYKLEDSTVWILFENMVERRFEPSSFKLIEPRHPNNGV